MKTAHQQAEHKIDKARAACTAVQKSWNAAAIALGRTVGTNGGGIYRDGSQLKGMMIEARQHIDAALKTLDQIDWPTNADYDKF